jgi:hypothetical protein
MKVLTLLPVVHEKEVVVHMGVAMVTSSPEPKPVTVSTGLIVCSGKPKWLPEEYVIATLGVTVNAAVPVLVPSETVTVLAPPGRFGTLTLIMKLPTAVVIKHPEVTRLAGIPAPPVPPLAVPQLPSVNHGTVVVPTVVVMVMGVAGAKLKPCMVRVVPTVPDGAAVRTPTLERVDRVTVGPAACAVLYGSRKTIPAIPARNSSPIVPKEASLLFGVNCVCILFTYFRNF